MKKRFLILIGIIGMIIFAGCQVSEGDSNIPVDEPVNPVNLSDLKAYIDSLEENTIDKPYVITVVNADSDPFKVICEIFKYKKIKKYISLDLSRCDFDSIPAYAFYGSSMIVELVLPKKEITINAQAFGKTSIRKVENSEFIVSLIGDPFMDTAIKYIELSGLKKMDEAAFIRNGNITVYIAPENQYFKTLYDGKAIVSKDETVFYELLGDNITELILPETYKEIGEDACSYRQLEKVVLPASLEKLGRYSFAYNSNLKTINIPRSITVIEAGTFHSCSSLPTVELPDTVTKISGMAFTSCTSLTSFKIPASVKFVGNYNFFCATNISGKIEFEVTEGWKKVRGDEPVSADYIKNFVTNYEFDIYRD